MNHNDLKLGIINIVNQLSLNDTDRQMGANLLLELVNRYVAAQAKRPYIEPHTLEAINSELEHQRAKWGADKPQSFAGFLLILQAELDEAKQGWLKDREVVLKRNTALAEIVQVAAVAISCLNRYGIVGCPASLNDTLPKPPQ